MEGDQGTRSAPHCPGGHDPDSTDEAPRQLKGYYGWGFWTVHDFFASKNDADSRDDRLTSMVDPLWNRHRAHLEINEKSKTNDPTWGSRGGILIS